MNEKLICDVQKELEKFHSFATTRELIEYGHYISGHLKNLNLPEEIFGKASTPEGVLNAVLGDDGCLVGLIDWLKKREKIKQ